jgi:hypothetical protein
MLQAVEGCINDVKIITTGKIPVAQLRLQDLLNPGMFSYALSGSVADLGALHATLSS